jgi:hypothetical protein
MFLRGTPKLTVDLGKLKNEHESLCSFLSSKLESEVVLRGNKILIPHDSLSAEKLKQLVNKFVYHQHLNHTFWVELEGNVVKLNKFERNEKKTKQKHGTVPSTIKHGW